MEPILRRTIGDTAVAIGVLVVDDDSRVRRALRALLEAAGTRVVATCRSGNEARRLLRDGVDLVVADLLLPDAERGLKLVADLTAAGLPVVAISVQGGLRSAALAAGAVSFLEKDGLPDTLISGVRAAALSPRTASNDVSDPA